MTVTVKETCKCGATFEYSGDASCAHLALKGFQAAHMPCRTRPADDDKIGTESRDWRGRVR